MLKRIKNLWAQSQSKTPLYLDVSKLDELERANLKKAMEKPGVVVSMPQEAIGDGNAVFFGEGTEEEFKELQNEDKGLKGIFGL